MSSLFSLLILLEVLNPTLSYTAYEDIPYKTVEARSLRLDVFAPVRTAGAVPAVVFVHGGAWNFGNRRDNLDFARHVAAEGMAAVLIDFRDALNTGFERPVRDIKDAIRWVRAHAADFNIDPDRIGLFGSSSGAHLASLAAYAGNGESFGDDSVRTSSRVQACFLLYGVYDLETIAEPGQAKEPLFSWYVNTSVDNDPLAFARYRTVTYVDGSEPSTLLIHGTDDDIAPYAQAEALLACLQEHGVPAELVRVDRLGHGFARKQPWLRPWMADVITSYFQESLRKL